MKDPSLKLKLEDENGKIVRNGNPIMLNVELYTNSNPPRKLEMNTAGRNGPHHRFKYSETKCRD